ncbi:hypothetical protein AEQ67_18700 [Pseudomonas sp. RIT-PI-q]|uniref:response regulator transcription factor n=1 Tax=Pseudomonas sp. RIT-PI-q TaxID=1690247 RepID=UPI0006CD96C5|nr:response regulator [Pseudomonas sp. RIT-PI-q]KPG95973.1 hypothetical protein AEQ67_18700 [Pseudomonas sp. RIT-PI-q]
MSIPLVFIVDDDISVRTSLEGLIRALGYLVESFSAPKDFLESASIRDSVCLILDVQMPGLSGLDVQRRLVEQGIYLPIIFITAFPDPSVRAKAISAGALALLSKPFDVLRMVDLIEGVVSGLGCDLVNEGIST